MIQVIGEIIRFLITRFSGETVNGESGELFFPYRTVYGELGKQGEYIYRRYILPISPFSTGAKGAVGGYLSLYPTTQLSTNGGAV